MNVQKNLSIVARKGRSLASRVAVGVGGAVASGLALAQSQSLGQQAAAALDGAKSDISTVQVAIIGILVLLVAFFFIKKAMGR